MFSTVFKNSQDDFSKTKLIHKKIFVKVQSLDKDN